MDLIRNGYNVYIGKNDAKEIDFIAEKGEDKIYIQVAYMLYDEATIQREFGGLMEINNHYPKYVLTMDKISAGNNCQRIKQVYLNKFLLAKDKTKM